MILFRYVIGRYIRYFIVINTVLTLLFNLVDFFEKVTRLHHASLGMLAHFFALTFLPSFFDSFPLSGWLATCMLIKEFDQQREWETLQLMTIGYRQIMKPLCAVALVLTITCIVGKEGATLALAQQAESFKREHIKQQKEEILCNCWMQLGNHHYCHIGLYDKKEERGKDIVLFEANDQFIVSSIIFAPTFATHPHNQTITFESGIMLNQHNEQLKNYPALTLDLPAFFTHCALTSQILSCAQLTTTLLFMNRYLSLSSLHSLSHTLAKRLAFYADTLFFPLITYALFYTACLVHYQSLAVIIAVYPVFLVSTTLINWLIDKGLPAWLLAAQYLLMLLFLIQSVIYVRSNRTFSSK